MANDIQPKNLGELQQYVAKRITSIKSVIATNVTPEKMARIALNELRTNDYLAKLAIQNPASFMNAISQASHLGLEIGGALGQAYLVPFKGEVKMLPGYRGLIALARRSGKITSINAEIVYEHDEFDLKLGLEAHVVHKPKVRGDRGEPILVYMVAHFKDGGHHFEWMSIEEVMRIKERSSAVIAAKTNKKPTPWDTDRDEMIRKTVIRRGWKYLPMSIEMQHAQIIESAAERGQTVTIDDSVIEGELIVTDTPTDDTPEVPDFCTDAEFEELKQECEMLVRSGKKTAKSIITTTQTRSILTDPQKLIIESWESEGK